MAPKSKKSVASTNAPSKIVQNPAPSSIPEPSAAPPVPFNSPTIRLPLKDHYPRTILHSGALCFLFLTVPRSLSISAPISISSSVKVLVDDPTMFLAIMISGTIIIQTIFGLWVRTCRRQALSGEKVLEQTAVKSKVTVKQALNEVKKQALSAKIGKTSKNKSAEAPLDTKPVVLITIFGAFAFFAGSILLGAPLSSKLLETFLFTFLLSVLALTPTAIAIPHTETYTWLRLVSSFTPANDLEFALVAPALGAIVGAWCGAIPIPLDWDRPWQAWPTTCVVGSLIGHCIGAFVSLGYSTITEIASLDEKKVQ